MTMVEKYYGNLMYDLKGQSQVNKPKKVCKIQ